MTAATPEPLPQSDDRALTTEHWSATVDSLDEPRDEYDFRTTLHDDSVDRADLGAKSILL